HERGRGDGDERERPGLALHRLDVDAPPLERALRHTHRGDELPRADGVLAPLAAPGRDEQLRELHAPLAEARRDLDLRVARDERGLEIGWRAHPAPAGT